MALKSQVVLVCVVGSVLITACATSGHNLGDGDRIDGRRAGALAVFVNREVTDQIDVEAGDPVDWKYCDVPRPGKVQLALGFDNPDQIEGQIIFRDNFGAEIERQQIRGGKVFYEFSPVQASRARYYVEIEGESGKSVYTVGVLFEEPDVGTFLTEAREEEVLVQEVAPTQRGPGGRVRSQPPEEVVEVETVAANAAAPRKKAADERAEGVLSISGTVRRITPLEDGGSVLTILLLGDDVSLVRSGARGTINGLGARVVVRSRAGKYLKAVTKAESDTIEKYRAVTFLVGIKE